MSDKIRDLLVSQQDKFMVVLQDKERVEHFIQSAVTVVNEHPEWLGGEYNKPSLLRSIMYAAESKLSMIPELGQIYFVPRRKKRGDPQKHIFFCVGYRGYMELAYRSGEYIGFKAECVFKGDKFDWNEGTNEFISHKAAHLTAAPDAMQYVWAKAILKDGRDGPWIVLPKSDVDKARSQSDSGASDWSPWNKHYKAMCRKTAIRQLCKFLHMSNELLQVIGIEDRAEYEFLKDCRPQNARELALEEARKRALPPAELTAPPSVADSEGGDCRGGPDIPSGAAHTLPASAGAAPSGEDLDFPEVLIPDE